MGVGPGFRYNGAPMSIIECRNLVKQYPEVRAVDGVSFSIDERVCFGLLGPNGAGKTTTVEIMEGVTEPTSGEVLYRGEPIGKEFRNDAGIQFQKTALQEYLTVRETLELFGSLYPRNMPLDEVVQMCALGDFLDRDARKLSGGQRQRLLLALALVNDPTVLFLDEPTTGLDPQARHNFWDLVNTIKERGKTILLTTHYMEEAYVLCDEIAIMDRGKIIAQGSPQELLSRQFEGVIVELPADDFREPPEFPWKHHVRNGRVEIETSDANEALSQLLAHGVSLSHVQVKNRTLEDLFLELTGRDLRA